MVISEDEIKTRRTYILNETKLKQLGMRGELVRFEIIDDEDGEKAVKVISEEG